MQYYSTMLPFKKLGFACLCLMLAGSVWAQNTSNSPYSRYGVGDLSGSLLSSQFSMGGMYTALDDPLLLNFGNPASYASLTRPVVDVGVFNRSTNISSGTQSQSFNSISFRNLAFGFPISKRWGSSFGVMPYSSVGYNISDKQDITGIGTVEQSYEGSGGINQAYLGNAFKIIKKDTGGTTLSIGFNAKYLFGSLNKDRRVIYPDGEGFFNTHVSSATYVGDVVFDFGLLYTDSIGKHVKFMAGINFNIPSEVSAKQDQVARTYINSGIGFQLDRDTTEYIDGLKGTLSMPQKLVYGLGVEIKNKFYVGLQYKTQNWSDYVTVFGEEEVSGELKNSSEVALGMQYAPRRNSSRRDFPVKYRMGARYGNTYFNVSDTQLKEYGISFGVGLPMPKSVSLTTFNLGVELGERGTLDNNLLLEQFANIYIGISLSPHKVDRWFYKRKYD